MYAASACLILVLVVMGVSMLNSFDRMKSVQDTLDTLAGVTDTVETRETSGAVTAVTEEQAGEETADENAAQNEDPETDQDAQESQKQESPDAASSDGKASQPDVSDDGSDQDETTRTSAAGQAVLPAEGNGSDGVYVVEKGDTLAIISKKMYGDITHVDAICKMNGIENGNLIYIGQKLLLP